MDTNLVRDLIAMMDAKAASNAASSQSTILIWTMIIAATAPTLASIMAYFKAAAAKADGEKNTLALSEIHTAVNSKETATAVKIDEFQITVVKLSEQLAAAEEKIKAFNIAAEVAAGVAARKKET